ncbi:MAG: AmmeMemoRadiSam system radical SAM enzyme [Anaerolineae bacterium]|nr:AmmeMemoRadiSam system radical SAM enzyme [Anaerolineae bacterium]
MCEHRCVLRPDAVGICGVRKNMAGELFLTVYGDAVATHIDPIEKKPLYHFYPGSEALSIGTYGCNMRCRWCQNWELSQVRDPKELPASRSRHYTPEELVAIAQQRHIQSIAYTYNEPTVFFEYTFDVAKLAKAHDIRNVYVSNGYMSLESINTISPYLDAINVDLKGFTDKLYTQYAGAHLEPVKRNIEYIAQKTDIWIETTTLVIPGLNDSDEELRAAAEWLADVDPDMPWHVSAFYPSHKMMDRPRTPPATLERAYEIGKQAGIKHVYVGNVRDPGKECTYCPSCGTKLIERFGYSTRVLWQSPGRCFSCGTTIAGVWE